MVHAHPPHAVALTIAGIDLQMPIIPEIVVTIGGIPDRPRSAPLEPAELPDSIREIIRCSDTRDHAEPRLGLHARHRT